MLEQECEAVASYIRSCLQTSTTAGQPLSQGQLDLFDEYLAEQLQALVRLMKRRQRDEVRLGRRALAVSLQIGEPGCLIAQAADFADIDQVAARLVAVQHYVPRLFAGYALVREGERLRVLYPDIQAVLDQVQAAFEQARPTPAGRFVRAESADRLRLATLHLSYPAYYVYEVFQRPAMQGGWKSQDRTGRDDLVALLADASHKGHWFVQTPACFAPLTTV